MNETWAANQLYMHPHQCSPRGEPSRGSVSTDGYHAEEIRSYSLTLDIIEASLHYPVLPHEINSYCIPVGSNIFACQP